MSTIICNKTSEHLSKEQGGYIALNSLYTIGDSGNSCMIRFPVGTITPTYVEVSIPGEYSDSTEFIIQSLFDEVRRNSVLNITSTCPLCGTELLISDKQFCLNISCTYENIDFLNNQLCLFNLDTEPAIRTYINMFYNLNGRIPVNVFELFIFILDTDRMNNLLPEITEILRNLTLSSLTECQSLPDYLIGEDVSSALISIKEVYLILDMPNTSTNIINLVDLSLGSDELKRFLTRFILSNVDLLRNLSIYY